MHARYQDAMAAVRVHGKPDLFITFTCNPKHPDILDNLLPGQHPEDGPDIVARVFNGELDNLIHELKVDCIFGKPVALVYSIEFQQRGLPHAHILLTLDSRSKMNSSDNIDKAVRAELPQHQASALRHTVLTCLVHNPCGPMHRNAQCMRDGRCTKHFPKPYCDSTSWPDGDLHPSYKRRRPTPQAPWLQ